MMKGYRRLDLTQKEQAGVKAGSVTMTEINSEGFDLLTDRRKVRIDFESPINTVMIIAQKCLANYGQYNTQSSGARQVGTSIDTKFTRRAR